MKNWLLANKCCKMECIFSVYSSILSHVKEKRMCIASLFLENLEKPQCCVMLHRKKHMYQYNYYSGYVLKVFLILFMTSSLSGRTARTWSCWSGRVVSPGTCFASNRPCASRKLTPTSHFKSWGKQSKKFRPEIYSSSLLLFC